MKKFAKGCLITALSMFFIGIVILIICTIIGGTSLFNYLKAQAKEPHSLSDLLDGKVIAFHNDEGMIDFSENHPVYSNPHTNDKAALATDIRNLDLNLGGGECIISESSDEYFHISSEGTRKFQYYTEDQTFYVKGFDILTFTVGEFDNNCIYLEIPKDFLFENISIELGAGSITADTLKATDAVEMEIGAGELVTHSLSANMLITQLGAGNVYIQDAAVENSDIQIGLGNMNYSGTITGDLSAECGMGNLDLYLTDAYENHNYNLECAMGNITIDQETFNAVVYSNSINHNADSTFTLECGMGNMTVLFE